MTDVDAHAAGLISWAQDIRAALRRLDPTQSRVLRMVYFERRSRAQVARELDLTPGAVTAAMAAGMQALGLAVLASTAE